MPELPKWFTTSDAYCRLDGSRIPLVASAARPGALHFSWCHWCGVLFAEERGARAGSPGEQCVILHWKNDERGWRPSNSTLPSRAEEATHMARSIPGPDEFDLDLPRRG